MLKTTLAALLATVALAACSSTLNNTVDGCSQAISARWDKTGKKPALATVKALEPCKGLSAAKRSTAIGKSNIAHGQ
jgi:hypothetical protein